MKVSKRKGLLHMRITILMYNVYLLFLFIETSINILNEDVLRAIEAKLCLQRLATLSTTLL